MLGVGKTEWRDIKWNDQSIAAKKNVINSAQFIFSAYEDTARWRDDVSDLRKSKVTHQLLDCSDAHYFSDSDQHMRRGIVNTCGSACFRRPPFRLADRRLRAVSVG
uniref:ATPase involved in DNA repair n=2 Tax=unclassified Mycobacterium TaxID=2642494 RepID=A0A5Q5BT72_MYCSS